MTDQKHDSSGYTAEALEKVIHHTELPTTRLSAGLDGIIDRVGSLVSWLWIVLVGVIIANVVLRYVFASTSIGMEEFAWHVYATAFLIGLSYTLVSDHHVRVDVLHEGWSLKTQAWIEFLGLLLLLFPFLGIVIYHLIPYAHESYIANERSMLIAGLPYRWIMKYIMLIAFVLLAVSAFARFLKCTALLFGFPKPIKKS